MAMLLWHTTFWSLTFGFVVLRPPLKRASSFDGEYDHLRKPSPLLQQGLEAYGARETENSSLLRTLGNNWRRSCQDMRLNPRQYLTIPVVAALVGYVTNYVGVKMLFYPINWTGIPLLRFGEEQPFGLLGWQGIVPCKRYVMSNRMVEVTINQLLNVKEVFSRLSPKELAKILQNDVKSSILWGWLPSPIVNLFLRRTSKDMLRNIDGIVDIKSLVVDGLCDDKRVLSNMFQIVAKLELDFLVNSGFVFGFLLGLLQMVQWMLYPANWTLLASGSVVGYVTNWIALKWVFEPLNPTKIGPFVMQGMFLRRQKEVSAKFCEFITDNVLTSRKVWAQMAAGESFRQVVSRNVPLPKKSIDSIIAKLSHTVIPAEGSAGVALHSYTTKTLDLRHTLTAAMNKLSTVEFEQVLHPIFQEDELTLIMAGAVLGAFTGGLQWLWNVQENKKNASNAQQEGELLVANA